MGAGGVECCCANSPSRQHNFTANFLDTATAATFLPRRKAGFDKKRASSGSLRTATQTASTSNQRIVELPCLPQGADAFMESSRLQHAESPLHGGGGAGASLVERFGAQSGVEGLGLDGSVIVDPDQRTQEVLHRNDARVGWKLAVVIPILIQRLADGGIV